MLRDFGVEPPEATAIRIWDSTAEMRYLVIPMRPAGSVHLSESELATLVTRDSMIGTGLALTPPHTRLPEYARGKRGRIERVIGEHVFPGDCPASGARH